MGFTHGDRTLTIRAEIKDKEIEALLFAEFEVNSSWAISTYEGFYRGAISALRSEYGAINITFLVSGRG
jgi:hypothetical protein